MTRGKEEEGLSGFAMKKGPSWSSEKCGSSAFPFSSRPRESIREARRTYVYVYVYARGRGRGRGRSFPKRLTGLRALYGETNWIQRRK